jgi:16S rRNA (uracil1498-N3)-methyltransferase
MARLFVPSERLREDVIILSDADHRYLVRVLRLSTGDRVVLFDGTGDEAEAVVERVGPRALEVKIEVRRSVAKEHRPELLLIQALPKGEKFDLVVQKATELGVHRILPVLSERSIPRVDKAKAQARVTRWQKIASEAARQSGRADVPEIAPITTLATALAASPQAALKLFFWEEMRTRSLRSIFPREPPKSIAIAVGPEGGFSNGECEAAKEAGFLPVGLGPRLLRTETAALVALAILGFAVGDLG